MHGMDTFAAHALSEGGYGQAEVARSVLGSTSPDSRSCDKGEHAASILDHGMLNGVTARQGRLLQLR